MTYCHRASRRLYCWCRVADADRDPEFVSQNLQFPLPQAQPHAVAATAVRGDQQPRHGGIAGGTEFVPPAADALDGEHRGVVADAEIDPSGIVGDVVDAIGHRLAEFGDLKIMHTNRLGLPLGAQLTTAILEVSDKLFLLGVDRDRGFAGSLERLHLGVDVLELGVAVGVAHAFARLAVGLQAEAQAAQQAADQLLAGGEAPLRQRRRQTTLALADPQQGSLGIATDRRLHQLVQGFQQPRLGLDRRLAATSRPTYPIAQLLGARSQIGQATTDRAACNTGRPRHRCHPATSNHARFARSKQATFSLVQERRQRIEAGRDRNGIDHITRVDPPASASLPFMDSFVASLPPSRFFSSDSVVRARALRRTSEGVASNRRRKVWLK